MIVKKEWVIPTIVGIGSFIIGTGVGYVFTKNKQERIRKEEFTTKERELFAKIREADPTSGEDESAAVQLAFEIADHRKGYDKSIQQGALVFGRVNDAAQRLENVLAQLQDTGEVYLGKFIRQEHNEEETVMNVIEQDDPPIENVFTGTDSDWDYDVEIPSRNPEIPYTCHRDEYFEEMEQNNLGHSHSVLTYYRGDAILCDELDAPIYDPERVVGKLEFGRGSQDPNVVYIRNEKLMADYEVLLDPGYYQVEVLGQQVENGLNKEDLKHSIQKFRFE